MGVNGPKINLLCRSKMALPAVITPTEGLHGYTANCSTSGLMRADVVAQLTSRGDISSPPYYPRAFTCRMEGYHVANDATVLDNPDRLGALRFMTDAIWLSAVMNMEEAGWKMSGSSAELLLSADFIKDFLLCLVRSQRRLIGLYSMGEENLQTAVQSVGFASRPSLEFLARRFSEHLALNAGIPVPDLQGMVTSPSRVLGYLLELYVCKYIGEHGDNVGVYHSDYLLDLEHVDLVVSSRNGSSLPFRRAIDVSMGPWFVSEGSAVCERLKLPIVSLQLGQSTRTFDSTGDLIYGRGEVFDENFPVDPSWRMLIAQTMLHCWDPANYPIPECVPVSRLLRTAGVPILGSDQ